MSNKNWIDPNQDPVSFDAGQWERINRIIRLKLLVATQLQLQEEKGSNRLYLLTILCMKACGFVVKTDGINIEMVIKDQAKSQEFFQYIIDSLERTAIESETLITHTKS